MELGKNPPNPFVHNLEISYLQRAKMILVGLTLLPLRLVAALLCLLITTSLAYIGLYSLSPEDFDSKPFTGWRLFLRKVICAILRGMFFFCGFHRVRVIGKQADPSEARILAVAPHSSYFDALVVVMMGAPSVVAKAETSEIPFWGNLIKYTQPVLVHRNDQNSRQNTIRQIVDRSSTPGWQQVLIFPEGTCTNRSAFITFRPGAFLPGVAVQPVLIRYENQLDTITWTWEGLPAWKVLVYTLSQFTVHTTIEFLEPYTPSPAEVEDSKLFAGNVRSVMGERLGIPNTDCSYFDYLRIEKSQCRGKALQRLQKRLEEPLVETTRYLAELAQAEAVGGAAWAELKSRLGVGRELAELDLVLRDVIGDESGDLRHLRLSVLMADSQDALRTFLDHVFLVLDPHLGPELLTKTTCADVVQTHLFMSAKEARETVDTLSGLETIHARELKVYITLTKPNHLKVIRAMEDKLSGGMTDLLTKTAGFTAERMAAQLEKVAASSSSLVSDMSATVAAGRDKVTDALSSAVTSLHKRTDSYSDKKKD